jgi:hypothetical protein
MEKQPKILGEISEVIADPVVQVQDLLCEAQEQDVELLKQFNLLQANKQPATPPPIDVSEVMQQAVNKVYSKSELRKLALKYDLKLRPAEEYLGPINLEMAYRLKAWNEAKVAKGISYYPHKLLILAPRELFVKKVVVLEDPIAFYPLVEGKYFEYAGHCGDDFTDARAKQAKQRLFWPSKWGFGGWFVAIVSLVLFGVCGLGMLSHIFCPNTYWNMRLQGAPIVLVFCYLLVVLERWVDKKYNFMDQETIYKTNI